MSFIADWILGAARPLLLATAKGKRKPAKKRGKRPSVTARPRAKHSSTKPRAKKAARPTKRPARPVARGKPIAGRARPPLHAPAAATAAPKLAEPPPPKPVPPIGRAILLSPENEKFVDSFHPTFRWLSVGGATRYEIAWSEDPLLSASHTLLSIATEATVPAEEPLRLGVTYSWRVRGGNASGWGPWSAVSSFRVLEEIA